MSSDPTHESRELIQNGQNNTISVTIGSYNTIQRDNLNSDEEIGYLRDWHLERYTRFKQFWARVCSSDRHTAWIQTLKGSRAASALPAIVTTLIVSNLPVPDELSSASIRLLGVFSGVIMGLLTSGYEMSIVLAIALLTLTLTRSFMCQTEDGLSIECDKCQTSFKDSDGHLMEYKCNGISGGFDVAISGFSNKVAWLVFTAFHIGRAVEKTHFGRRISLILVQMMGSSTIGIGYSICLAELVLAPFIPSNTARGGGIVFPVVESVGKALGVGTHTGQNKLGGFLSLVASSANLVSSSLFVTGMAGNPIVAKKASTVFGIEFGFTEWFAGAFVPVAIILVILPPFFHALLKPKVDFTGLSHEIRRQRNLLGSMSTGEIKLCVTLSLCLVLWVGNNVFGIDATVVSFMGILLLVLFDVLEWKDILQNAKAWDTFFWLASFIVLAEQLTALGVTDWIGNSLSQSLHDSSPVASTLALSMAYFFSTYMFSSISSHVIAFSGPFFSAARVLNCPPHLITIIVAIFSSTSGLLTPFSTGSVAIYASQGHVSHPRWFMFGLLSSILVIFVVFSVGLLWWKILGWY